MSRITGISSMAARGILAELAAAYGRMTGRAVEIRSMGGVEAARLVREGEPVDLVFLAERAVAELEAAGRVVPGSRVAFARSGVALAVPAGTAHPPITDEAAVKRALLDAGRIAYSTGPSGTHLRGLIERWGVAALLADRLVQAPPGVAVGTLLAEGRAEIGLQQASELLGLPGIEVLGPLPEEVQAVTVFAGGVAASSTAVPEARAFLAHLAAPETATVKRRHGMEPS